MAPQEVNLTHKLRPRQASVLRAGKRFTIVVAGRRWGKTWLALWWLIINAASGPNRMCYYVGPTYTQTKRIAWDLLKRQIPAEARRRISEEELLIELPNGSIIQLHGADCPDSLRGVGLNCIVLDEYAQMNPGTWSAVVRPMLADRRGSAMFIGTPRGRNHFYDLYAMAASNDDWAVFRFRTAEGGYVAADELAAARCEMDQRMYAQEFDASFEDCAARVYHAFDLDKNVADLSPLQGAPLMIGMDFNISPMTAVIAQRAGDQCQVIDEIVLFNSNTQEMMNEINRRYRGRHGVVHPDPSGVARRTSAPVGQTDFTIIEEAGWPVYRATIHKVVDRINNVNAMLCNAQGNRKLLISRSCKHLVKSLDGLTYKEGTKIPDKASGLDHSSDALGYLIMNAFPLISNSVRSFTIAL